MSRLERFLALAEASGAWSGIGMSSKFLILGRIKRDPEETSRRIELLAELWRRSQEV